MAQSKPFLINDYPVIIGIDFGKVLYKKKKKVLLEKKKTLLIK
jgi:hypothetical protein